MPLWNTPYQGFGGVLGADAPTVTEVQAEPADNFWDVPVHIPVEEIYATTPGTPMPAGQITAAAVSSSSIFHWNDFNPATAERMKKKGLTPYVLLYCYPEKDELGLTYIREQRVLVSPSTKHLESHIDRYTLMRGNGEAKIVTYESL